MIPGVHQRRHHKIKAAQQGILHVDTEGRESMQLAGR